jgi:hypothetical protein
MTALGDTVTKALGRPQPLEPNGVQFPTPFTQRLWEATYQEIGAGWYLDGFVYLFGPKAAALQRCLDAWPFVVPPKPGRVILGRNAYGMILVADDPAGHENTVYVLDPFTVRYYTLQWLQFSTLLGRFLPERLIPHFLDDSVYRAWQRSTGRTLEGDLVLGPKIPEGLGGELTLANVMLDDIFAYYESMAPIHAKAFALADQQTKAQATKKARPPARPPAKPSAKPKPPAKPKSPAKPKAKAKRAQKPGAKPKAKRR